MTKKYTAIIDVDTLIIHASLAGQETSVVVTHKETGWNKVFKNKTEFHGHHSKREGGWLGTLNESRELKVSPDDFEITPAVVKIGVKTLRFVLVQERTFVMILHRLKLTSQNVLISQLCMIQ